MVTILHAADLHLDSPFRGLSPDRAARRRRELRDLPRRLAALAREHGADLMLLAGDLFDGTHLYRETGEALAAALGEAGCPVCIAPGNHDPFQPGSPWETISWPDNVHLFTSPALERVVFPQLGCTVYGAAFTSSHREDDPLAGFTAPEDGLLHLGVLHGEVQPGSTYGPIAPESIARSGLDYLALGHIHTRRPLEKSGATHWGWPGCPEGRGFDETGDKGVLLVKVDKGRAEETFLPAARRRYHLLTAPLKGGEDPAAALAATLAGREEDICRVTFTGDAPAGGLDLAALEGAGQGLCFSLELRDATTLPRDLWARAGEDTLTGLFLSAMAEKIAAAGGEARETLELAARFGLAALENREDLAP